MLRKILRQTHLGTLPVRQMATESEIKSASGIASIEHVKYSKKQFQKLKDKNHVSIENIVDTT